MNARREKVKQQNSQINKQLETVVPKPEKNEGGTWKENLGKYLIDISKYVVTGVIITSTFKDLNDKVIIFIISFVIAISALIVGLILTNKKKRN